MKYLIKQEVDVKVFELELNKIYQNIAQKINDTIPVEWDIFYFNAEIHNQEGGVLFFFNTPDRLDEYIYSHDIPDVFNVTEKEYDKKYDELFHLSIELQEIFIKNNQEPWYSFDMIVTSEGKVKIHYGYTKWYQSTFGPSDRVNYFEYKYLGKKPSNENERRKFEEMKEYEEQNKS